MTIYWLLAVFILGSLVFSLGLRWYITKKHVNIWLMDYLRRLLQPAPKIQGPVHLMVMVVDHFELNGHQDRLHAWTVEYPKIVDQFRDADGHKPQHTFFYALDLMHEHELKVLQPLVEQGYGEFELHWHHAHDTSETFVQKLQEVMPVFQRYGYMQPVEEGKLACFAFIHGNWSLDNSRGAEFCGVDNEIQLLQELGCYADFTFPALFQTAQPRYINSIQYAVDDGAAKSYDTARQSQTGVQAQPNEFMIFQGPLTINWLDWRHKWHPNFEDGDLHAQATHGDPRRIKAWVRQAIHVAGRPEWQFVKLFSHGAQDHKSLVGPATARMFQYFQDHYNDGQKYVLHYVNAREAYNIVKAAEDGLQGNPNDYRDYKIPHPLKRITP